MVVYCFDLVLRRWNSSNGTHHGDRVSYSNFRRWIEVALSTTDVRYDCLLVRYPDGYIRVVPNLGHPATIAGRPVALVSDGVDWTYTSFDNSIVPLGAVPL